MTYYYTISYDENKDEFFAYVDKGDGDKQSIFFIESTEEMCDLISTGIMDHIDDVDGLLAFLQRQNFLKPDDDILINETVLE